MDKKTLVNAFKLSYVPRWSVCDMLKPQSVSDHVYRVQIIALHLIQKLKLPIDEGKMIMDILFHDNHEGTEGDLPSSCKSANQVLEPSGSQEKALLRLADTIEAAIQLHRYGKNPHRVMRFLERKMQFTQSEISEYFGISLLLMSETVDNLISLGRNYD